MPITAGCPQCGKTYRVKDDFGGKKFRCKACQGVVSVPEPQEPSGDPWDDLDIDSFQDQGAADSHEAEYEFETPPAPRRKARTKKSRRRRSRSTDGMPVGVMVAVGCECVLILGNLAGIVLNIVQQTPSGACAPVFRILIELSIVLGLLNRQNVARWASIALSILGIVFCMACGAFLAIGGANLPPEMQRQLPQEMIVLFLAIFGLQIVIWGINTVMLLLPSSGDYFD